MKFRVHPGWFVALLCLFSFPLPAASVRTAEAEAEAVAAKRLAEVLVGFDLVQESITTLSARFTETTENSLLTDAIVAQGQVFLTKPDSVRWEYSSPEEMRFVIADDQYTGYFPDRKQAEQRNIQRWREHMFRFLGLGQPSSELSSFYDIRLDSEAQGHVAQEDVNENVIALVLDPRKKRVRKRMESVRFWIDATTFLPLKIQYRTQKGDTRTIDFEAMEVNPPLETDIYTVELPSDVKITKGFSALSGMSSVQN